MPVYDPVQIPSLVSNPEHCEYLLLRLLAENFEYELKLERRLQSTGIGKLPDEWRAYREREHQKTWDKVRQYELNYMGGVRDEESISLSHEFLAGYPLPNEHLTIQRTPTSTPVSHIMDDRVSTSRPTDRSTSAQRMPPFASQ